MKRVVDDWYTSVQRTFQRTEECLGQASATEINVDVRSLMDSLDAVNVRNTRILQRAERVLMRHAPAGVSADDYLYQHKEVKKQAKRTNNLTELAAEMTFAGREFGPHSEYGRCLNVVGACEERLGQEELRFVTQAATGFLTPLKRFLDTSVHRALKERRALLGCRLDLDAARTRLKKAQLPEKRAAAESAHRTSRAQYERQVELTRVCCQTVEREKQTQIDALSHFLDVQRDYHAKSLAILDQTRTDLLAALSSSPSLTARTSATKNMPAERISARNSQQKVAETVVEPDLLPIPIKTRIRARVRDGFSGQTASELSIKKYDLVDVMEDAKPTQGWLLVKKRSGQVGYVPKDNVDILPDEDEREGKEEQAEGDGVSLNERLKKSSVSSLDKEASKVTFNRQAKLILSNHSATKGHSDKLTRKFSEN